MSVRVPRASRVAGSVWTSSTVTAVTAGRALSVGGLIIIYILSSLFHIHLSPLGNTPVQ